MKEILTLVQLQHEGDTTIAMLGGFDLDYVGERFGKDGYRYTTMLMRTGADYEIDLSVTTTTLGAIARVEHALAGFEEEQERCRQRLADVEHRLTTYRSRAGGEFSFSDELADKQRQMAEVDINLADGLQAIDERSAA